MKEDEFRALLALEGKRLKVEQLNDASLYYIALITKDEVSDYSRYAIGKTPKHALHNLINQYYADT